MKQSVRICEVPTLDKFDLEVRDAAASLDTRECLALVADSSLTGLRVVRELDSIIAWRSGRRCACPTTAPN